MNNSKNMELIVERRNLDLSRIVDTEYLVDDHNTTLFQIDAWGARNNENIKDIPLEDNESWAALKDIEYDNRNGAYCYIKFSTINDIRKQYKEIYLTHIIADEIVVNQSVFERIFRIFFRQESGTPNNRLFIGNNVYCFSNDSANVAADVASCIYEIFEAKTIKIKKQNE